MMTQIIFMTRDGRVAYCGSARGLRAYLEQDLSFAPGRTRAENAQPGGGLGGGLERRGGNPADDLLDVMGLVAPSVLVETFKTSRAGEEQRRVLEMLEIPRPRGGRAMTTPR